MKIYQLIHTATQVVANMVVIDHLEQYPVPAGYSLKEVSDTSVNSRVLSVLQFKRRFTITERIAVRYCIDPFIQDYMNLLETAPEVCLDDPDTIAGVHYLESHGLIAEGRAQEILTSP
jgi:hypothetical protein